MTGGTSHRARLPAITLALVLMLLVVAALPVVVAHYPQMADYPAHLARYRIMLQGAGAPDLARHYAFTWQWSGNLGVDIVMLGLGPLLGVEPAGRLIAGLIPVLTCAGIFLVEWALRRRIGASAILALPAVWSPALVDGFLNYTLSIALALLAFALWIETAGRRWREPLFVAVGLAVYLCHQSGWGVLGILVLGCEFAVRRPPWRAALATWPLWAPLVLVVTLGGGVAGAITYGADPLQWKFTNWVMALAVHDVSQDILTTVLMIGLVIWALVRRRIDTRLGWSALLLALLSFAMPRHLGGGDFADYRLTAVALMVGCMAIDWPLGRGGLIVCALPFLIRTATLGAYWHERSAQLEVVLGALDHIPRGARVAGAMVKPLASWEPHGWSHIICYATLRRGAVTNADFAIPGIHMLRLRQFGAYTDPSQVIDNPGESHPDLAAFAPAQDADYLWFIGPEVPRRLPAGAVVQYRAANSLLLRLAPPVEASVPATSARFAPANR